MILEQDEKITLGGETYTLRFPVKSIFNVEKELGESILHTLAKMQQSGLPTMHETCVLLKWAIIGGGKPISEETAELLFLKVMDEKKFALVLQALAAAIVKSGVVGNPKKVMAGVKKAKKMRENRLTHAPHSSKN